MNISSRKKPSNFTPGFGAAIAISPETIKELDKAIFDQTIMRDCTLANEVIDYPSNELTRKIPEIVYGFVKRTVKYPYTLIVDRKDCGRGIVRLSLMDHKKHSYSRDVNGQRIQIIADDLLGENAVGILVENYHNLRQAMENRTVIGWIKNRFSSLFKGKK